MVHAGVIGSWSKLLKSTTLRNSLTIGWRGIRCSPPRRALLSFSHSTGWIHTGGILGTIRSCGCCLVYGGGEPIGIVPLCVRREAYRVGQVRVLTYPLDNWSTWYGPIGPNPATTMMAAMQHFRRSPRDWDMMELRWVADDGVQGGRTARAMRVANMLSEKREYEVTSLVDLPGTWDEYLARKSPSARRHFRRIMRTLSADERVEYIRHRPLRPAKAKAIRAGICMPCANRSRWPVGSRSVDHGNTLTHDRVREYFHATHAAAARVGMVDMNVLLADGQPAAFLYGYHYRNQ